MLVYILFLFKNPVTVLACPESLKVKNEVCIKQLVFRGGSLPLRNISSQIDSHNAAMLAVLYNQRPQNVKRCLFRLFLCLSFKELLVEVNTAGFIVIECSG